MNDVNSTVCSIWSPWFSPFSPRGRRAGDEGEVCNMVHGAALVAPYGGLSVRIEIVCVETVGSISEA